MLTKEKERQFCELRDTLEERLKNLKVSITEANGNRKNIEQQIGIYEGRLKKVYNFFIGNYLGLALEKTEQFYKRNSYLIDEDSIFSEMLTSLLTTAEKFKYNRYNTRYSTFANLSMKRRFLNLIRTRRNKKKFEYSFSEYVKGKPLDECDREGLLTLIKEEEIERLNKGLKILTEKEREVLFRKYYLEDNDYSKRRYNTKNNALAKLREYFESFEGRSVA